MKEVRKMEEYRYVPIVVFGVGFLMRVPEMVNDVQQFNCEDKKKIRLRIDWREDILEYKHSTIDFDLPGNITDAARHEELCAKQGIVDYNFIQKCYRPCAQIESSHFELNIDENKEFRLDLHVPTG